MLSAKNNLYKFAIVILVCLTTASLAQTAQDQTGLAQLAEKPVAKIMSIPAKKLFGAQNTPAQTSPEAIGTYAKGCLGGGEALPLSGPNWQVMRPSRNRNWGTPQLVNLLEKMSARAAAQAGWSGLLIGDMSQPRGGPMKTGHASHQIGLDADIWFTPMPDHVMSAKERETTVPLNMVKSYLSVTKNWSEDRNQLVKIAATMPEIGRVFVHPPIKAELCKWATGDRSWLAKVRPIRGHTHHFHIRMKCPAGMTDCKDQAPPKPVDGTGCGPELARWQSYAFWHPKPPKPRDPNAPPPKPVKPAPPLTLAGLPAQCRAVIAAP